MKKIKFVIIGNAESQNSKDLEQEISKKGHDYVSVRFSDLVFEFDDEKKSFDIKFERGSLLEHDIFIFRGYNKSISEAQILAEWLSGRGKTVIDDFIGRKLVPSKMFEAMKFAENGIPHIKTFQAKGHDAWKGILQKCDFPVIVKPVDAQKGQGVMKFEDKDAALDFLEKNPKGHMLQEYIPIDGDIRVLVVGGKALGAMKRFVGKEDFRSNISVGAHAERIELDDELEKLALNACNAMGYEIAGVDIIEKDGRPRVLEVNFAPEWQGFKQATKTEPAKNIIGYALKKYAQI